MAGKQGTGGETRKKGEKEPVWVEFFGYLTDAQPGGYEFGKPISFRREHLEHLAGKYSVCILVGIAGRYATQADMEERLTQVRDWLDKWGIPYTRIIAWLFE